VTIKLFGTPRFRLRTMLVAVTVVALAGYLAREWMILRDARQQFHYAWASYEAARATSENVVLASRRLMIAEAAAPWISERKAEQLHLERMRQLLEIIESGMKELSPATEERQSEFVRGEIAKYDES